MFQQLPTTTKRLFQVHNVKRQICILKPRPVTQRWNSLKLVPKHTFQFKRQALCEDFELAKQSKEYQSEAFQFLIECGVVPELGFKQIFKQCPEVFEFSALQIGLSILSLKKSGISSQAIDTMIFYCAPQALVSNNCQFLISFCKLFEQTLHVSMDFGVEIGVGCKIGENLCERKSKMFFKQDLRRIESNILLLLQVFDQKTDDLITLFRKQLQLQRIDTKQLDKHIKNLSNLCDEFQQSYEAENLGDLFPSIKKTILLENLSNLGHLLCTQQDIQDARLKMQFLDDKNGALTELVDFPQYFCYDLKMCIIPRYEFVKQVNNFLNNKTSFKSSKFEGNKSVAEISATLIGSFSLRQLLECSDKEFCQQLQATVEQFNSFKLEYRKKIETLKLSDVIQSEVQFPDTSIVQKE
eukprot:TRINITY_DN30093_c0_g1_i6.p1 TRINITY_DN30093_c0_g1~~TRINITY_DN30093_c0_g1_i6.p1  ORF type:complete len:411 (+),score=17.42 TRINITY_DN30093_c0_g1_i6:52-1284(+)